MGIPSKPKFKLVIPDEIEQNVYAIKDRLSNKYSPEVRAGFAEDYEEAKSYLAHWGDCVSEEIIKSPNGFYLYRANGMHFIDGYFADFYYVIDFEHMIISVRKINIAKTAELKKGGCIILESKTYKNNSLHKMKNTIRLTESQLKDLIAESVRNVLNEIGETPKGQYMLGRTAARKYAAKKNSDSIVDYAEKKRKDNADMEGHYVDGWADQLRGGAPNDKENPYATRRRKERGGCNMPKRKQNSVG